MKTTIEATERPWNRPELMNGLPEITADQLEESRRRFKQALAEQEQAPEPIRVIKWVGGRYQTVTLTPEQVEATRRREAFVAQFNPCGL